MIIQGDCLIELKKLPDKSVDSIVTDPPYGISFMGKKWDYNVPSVEVWKEALRVLKPGGHTLVACGTRTQHRMAVNLEDAGFEIRDLIAWVYGSGFPKSLNIGKAVDKLQGNKREVVGELKLIGTARNTKTIGAKTSSAITSDYEVNKTKIDITKGNSPYEGWGTALKPAMELWTLCRKPLSEKTVAENALKWGTGGINIDGCRVEVDDNKKDKYLYVDHSQENSNPTVPMVPSNYKRGGGSTLGRFPSNLIHDGSNEVVRLFPKDAQKFFYCAKANKSERNKGLDGFEEKFTPASEFRPNHMKKTLEGEGGNPYGRWTPVKNNHPTVKPIKLMRYLCRLITPKGGIVLDPFMGSGSTGIGAKLEGFDFIGIELDPDYCKIAEARISAYEKELEQNKLI